jgi:hypothetical protein
VPREPLSHVQVVDVHCTELVSLPFCSTYACCRHGCTAFGLNSPLGSANKALAVVISGRIQRQLYFVAAALSCDPV